LGKPGEKAKRGKRGVNRNVSPCIDDVCMGEPPSLPLTPFVSICVHSWFLQQRAGTVARPYDILAGWKARPTLAGMGACPTPKGRGKRRPYYGSTVM